MVRESRRKLNRRRASRVRRRGGANDIIFGGSDAPARSALAAMAHQAAANRIRPMIGLPPPVYAEGIPEPWLALTDYKRLLPVFSHSRQVGPNSATTGVETPEARCMGPESPVTNASA